MTQNLSDREYLILENVSYSYPETGFKLKDVNLAFNRGEFVAINGHNASGKTTLGKIMAGILKPDRGRVMIKGRDTSNLSLGQIGKMIGYLFQQPERQLFTSTVREEVSFALNFMGEVSGESEKNIRERAESILEDFSLIELADEVPSRLSAGEKQRLALAAVIINRPGFLILDEPTTGLDPIRKEKLTAILKNLQNSGIGMMVISHDQAFVEKNADRVIIMSEGELFETRPSN